MPGGADAEELFRAVFEQHYGLILTTCRRRLSSVEAAEDAAAEVFRIAWQKMRGGKMIDLPWLYRTARNVVGNEYRRQGRSQALIEKVGLTAVVAGHDSPDGGATELRDAMSRLKKADQELLFMAYWEDLTVPEMASILRLRDEAIRMRLSRARQALRGALSVEHGGEWKAVTADG